jgi:hypothetical protein
MPQPDRALHAVTLAVVGAPFPNQDGSDRRFEIRLCAPGEHIDLRPEPKNRLDERAVAVFSCRGVQLGYLTAERCGRIGQLMREGRELQAVFQAETAFGAWIRVAFDGAMPVVPDATVAHIETDQKEPDTGWFPDEVWPDE